MQNSITSAQIAEMPYKMNFILRDWDYKMIYSIAVQLKKIVGANYYRTNWHNLWDLATQTVRPSMFKNGYDWRADLREACKEEKHYWIIK